MDRGPMMFTSDVSRLCKVNKLQLDNRQDYGRKPMLTMLQRKEEAQKHGQYAKVGSRKSIYIYYESSTLRYLSRTSHRY